MAAAITEQSPRAAFHPATLWHSSTPRRLVAKWQAGDAGKQWEVWRRYLARRKRPATPPFLADKRPPILWGWPHAWGRDELAECMPMLGKWQIGVEGTACERVELPAALQAVATAYALPGLAGKLDFEAWWRLAESLHALACDAEQLRADSTIDAPEIVRQQLLAGELPLALGYLFPELLPMRSLRKPARQALGEALITLTDGEGLPHARLLPVLGPLWACWTRSRWLGDRLEGGCWSRAAETQYQWLIRRAIQLADRDHGFLLRGDYADARVPGMKKLLAMALELAGDEKDFAAAATAVSRSVVPDEACLHREKLPKASINSEWSGLAVLTAGWSKSDPRLAIVYGDDPLTMELSIGGRRLFAGHWTRETWCDGRPVAAVGTWEELCWLSEPECDYLEVGLELADGLRLERQIVLAKEDHVLLVADAILSGDRSFHQLRHAFSLPLARGVAWRPEAETRDGLLLAGKDRAAVMPLALMEWRSDPRGGSLVGDGSLLTLSQEATGRAIYCPLLVDLKPRRAKKERTWRQLTVAESLDIVPRDLASGFRAQSGRDQWLVYRSLGPAGNRTLLGQNISTEFYAGRFLTTGEVDEWIEIEAE